MSEVQYQSAKTVKEAVKMMQAAKGKGYILAGGTDLLVQMKSGARTPGVIVDVKKISEMVTVTEKKGAYTIGAATPAAVLGENKKLRKAWPGVIEACNLIGSTQVQGRASPGGNLCNASPAADSVPAMIAARAVCVIAGPGGLGGRVKLTRISPGARLVRPGPAGTASTGIWRRPSGPCTVTMAPAATMAGTLSPAGEALHRLPPGVARPCTWVEPIRFTPAPTTAMSISVRGISRR